MIHRSAESSRSAGITYHLVPVPIWERAHADEWYTPEAYEDDGFIHCTNGLDELVQVANLFYTSDPRKFVVLVLDTGAIVSDLRYDDAGEVYPHIYGPLNTSAVRGHLTVVRDETGAFVDMVMTGA